MVPSSARPAPEPRLNNHRDGAPANLPHGANGVQLAMVSARRGSGTAPVGHHSLARLRGLAVASGHNTCWSPGVGPVAWRPYGGRGPRLDPWPRRATAASPCGHGIWWRRHTAATAPVGTAPLWPARPNGHRTPMATAPVWPPHPSGHRTVWSTRAAASPPEPLAACSDHGATARVSSSGSCAVTACP